MSEQKYPIKGGFFNSINGDRRYNAEDINKPYNRVITEGIFATPEGTASTDLQVLAADEGMNVIVKAGDGLLGGKWFQSVSDIAITVASNTSIVPRMDSVIIQIDKTQNGRVFNIVYREGVANSNPEPPDINKSENIIERRVANIKVLPNANYIGQEVITDLRGSRECPWITSLIKQVDTSVLFLQWKTAYEKYYDKSTKDFERWFNRIKEQLSEDAAGALQLEIDRVRSSVETAINNDELNVKTVIIPKGTIITNGYTIMLPLEYRVR